MKWYWGVSLYRNRQGEGRRGLRNSKPTKPSIQEPNDVLDRMTLCSSLMICNGSQSRSVESSLLVETLHFHDRRRQRLFAVGHRHALYPRMLKCYGCTEAFSGNNVQQIPDQIFRCKISKKEIQNDVLQKKIAAISPSSEMFVQYGCGNSSTPDLILRYTDSMPVSSSVKGGNPQSLHNIIEFLQQDTAQQRVLAGRT